MRKTSYNNQKSLKSKNKKYGRRKGRSMPFYIHIIPTIVYVLLLYRAYLKGLYLYELIILLVLPIAYMLIAKIIWFFHYRKTLLGASINRIDKMTGEEFEDYLALLYKKQGFEVKTTPKTCDFGADLLLKDPKTGKKICVQAKRYRGLVGEEAVQQTLSGREYYKCDCAMIITNSHYTDAAKKLAKSCDISMIDRFQLGTKKMYQF